MDSSLAITSAAPIVSFKKRAPRAKTNIRKRPATAPSSRDESSDPPSSDDDDDDSLQVPRAKRRHNNDNKDHGAKAPNTELFSTTFKADRDASLINQEDATKQQCWTRFHPLFQELVFLGRGLWCPGNLHVPETAMAPATYKRRTNTKTGHEENDDDDKPLKNCNVYNPKMEQKLVRTKKSASKPAETPSKSRRK
ncbi:hypothetical protein NM208_g10548 [Fusarium decemcellulare]|uniref:Uncharacterized protein n=1 Tax=Fusarium decemcellulare TaxID=57161 RepID=A0ACC1RXI7_9HYPO|nr:hypothetical protein NM208_g10548 [Fusarium decemcellulare]